MADATLAECRRLTCRDNARQRRETEAEIFADLSPHIPFVAEEKYGRVDKIAYLRLCVAWCRLRDRTVLRNPVTRKEGKWASIWCEQTLSESLDGFVLIADTDGTILFITKSVSHFIGLTQTDLVGHPLSDYVNHTDYKELVQAMQSATKPRAHAATFLTLRMKALVTQRGRSLCLNSCAYKPVHIQASIRQTIFGQTWLLHGSASPTKCEPLLSAPMYGSEEANRTFVTRHTPDMRFSYVSGGWNIPHRCDQRNLIGTSFYDVVFPADLHMVAECMRQLTSKGQCRTPFYRWLSADATLTWVQTEAMIVSRRCKEVKDHYVLCTHYALGTQTELESWSTPFILADVNSGPKGASTTIVLPSALDDRHMYLQLSVPLLDIEPVQDLTADFIEGPDDLSLGLDTDGDFSGIMAWVFEDGNDELPSASRPSLPESSYLSTPPVGPTENRSHPTDTRHSSKPTTQAIDRSAVHLQTDSTSRDGAAMEPPNKMSARGGHCNNVCSEETAELFAPHSEHGQLDAQLAPYIAQEDQFAVDGVLPSDLETLFADVDFSSYFPSEANSTPSVAAQTPVQHEWKTTDDVSPYRNTERSFDECTRFFDDLGRQYMSNFVF